MTRANGNRWHERIATAKVDEIPSWDCPGQTPAGVPASRGMLTLFTLPFVFDRRWFSDQANLLFGIMPSHVLKARPGAPENGKTSLSETYPKMARSDPSYTRLKQGNRLKQSAPRLL